MFHKVIAKIKRCNFFTHIAVQKRWSDLLC